MCIDCVMDDFKALKSHDFGYGNEIPSFLEFLHPQQSYWSILYKKIMDEGKSKSPALADYIAASRAPADNRDRGKRKSFMHQKFAENVRRQRNYSSMAQGKA